ncbi:hypothetical protein Micbo1qcDRAFT_175647 [Microdochium bolleyi]|uniref:Uncharacterized protein n=1 Tax=Microdochium bolleyi TaxID=196109 RepID=A0A136J3B2_9PEZI|nr:hypothetical protein Micbo1qcDRAFT_175647 [Microdochium bolleyi]
MSTRLFTETGSFLLRRRPLDITALFCDYPGEWLRGPCGLPRLLDDQCAAEQGPPLQQDPARAHLLARPGNNEQAYLGDGHDSGHLVYDEWIAANTRSRAGKRCFEGGRPEVPAPWRLALPPRAAPATLNDYGRPIGTRTLLLAVTRRNGYQQPDDTPSTNRWSQSIIMRTCSAG